MASVFNLACSSQGRALKSACLRTQPQPYCTACFFVFVHTNEHHELPPNQESNAPAGAILKYLTLARKLAMGQPVSVSVESRDVFIGFTSCQIKRDEDEACVRTAEPSHALASQGSDYSSSELGPSLQPSQAKPVAIVAAGAEINDGEGGNGYDSDVDGYNKLPASG